MSGPVDAVGELIRTRSMRIHLTDEVSYVVRSPCLLQQLEEALGLGSESGGRGVPASRPLVNAEVWDVYVHITTATHAWAEHLGIDRRRYRRENPPPDPSPRERTPAWMDALAAWNRPVAWDEEPERLVAERRDRTATPIAPLSALLRAAAGTATPVAIHDRSPRTQIPELGLLLRAAAAQAVAQADDPVAATMTRLATRWAKTIRTLLRQLDVEDKVWPIRGAACGQCGATVVIQARHDDGCDPDCDAARCLFHVPAVEVRLQPIGAGPDDGDDGDSDEALWACQWCLACGDNGWLASAPRLTRAA